MSPYRIVVRFNERSGCWDVETWNLGLCIDVVVYPWLANALGAANSKARAFGCSVEQKSD